ncbi:prolyl aminopeptidase [Pseudonocardia petroleophila]|uniref:Proline iminopeptidase n=1 Tax=Pseudonocardia petroleophila TaxID=37331 RepID=A0A7G7MHZ1_9PSEU|nr:prolyl aminopeptidase [Pseudonocardia petroleophila]QNG52402.1 prolyl aminopeptidase [Pseudonocardia petroleophila]
MTDRYPAVEPHHAGMVDVGDGQRIRFDVRGNPSGTPAVVVHGGPGSGAPTGTPRSFDPQRYRVVSFDQRGCGGSTPHASDPSTSLEANTTAHLVADLEALRAHLGVDRWVVFGGSWGSTLALAYAQAHPERVRALLLVSVTTTRRSEIDWLYRGVGRFLPREWAEFRARHDDDDLLGGYARLLADPDAGVRERAALAWATWEDAVLSLEPTARPAVYAGRPSRDLLALTRLCAHYFSHGAFLDEGVLIRDAGRLAGIPGVLVHGRLDMGGPPVTAWELARAWPGAELHLVEEAGHLGSAEFGRLIRTTLDGWARGATRPTA